MTNKLIGLVLLTQIVLALIGGAIGALWSTGEGTKASYMGGSKVADGFGFYLLQ